MEDQARKRLTTRLKELIFAPELLIMPAAFDPLSAKIAARSGFQAVQCTGLGIAATTLGVPDYGIISLGEMVERTRVIADAVTVPVMGDADTGFGNAVNVTYTVRAFERAGAAGVNIEDQVFPKRCGHLGGKELIAESEMALKVEAARYAAADADFVVNARTDALAVEGIDGAIHRGNAYLEAGATMVYVDAVETLEQVRRLAGELRGPLGVSMVEGGRTDPNIKFDDLQDAGAARVSLSLSLLMASVKAMQEILRRTISDGGIGGHEDMLYPFEELQNLVGMSEIRELEDRFASS